MRVEDGSKGERAVLREQDGVTVFSRQDDAAGADRAPRAGPVDRKHRRLQQPRDLFAQGARGDVGSVARRKRNHDGDRPGGERLGIGGGGQPDQRAGEKGGGQKLQDADSARAARFNT